MRNLLARLRDSLMIFFAHNIGTASTLIVLEALYCSFRGHAIAYPSCRNKKMKFKEQTLAAEVEQLTLY